MGEAVRASVIVPTINIRPDLLAVCAESVERTLGPDDELLIIEGGTFSQNCNAGAQQATGEYLIFVNDDCKIDQDDWIDRLLVPFGDPEVGITGCRLIYPSGKIQHAGVYFTLENGMLMGNNRHHDQPSGVVDAVTGACLAIPRALFLALGGFDPLYRNGNEDIDLCLSVRQAGYVIWYESAVTLIHHESASGPARWLHVAENVRRLQDVWHVSEQPAG
jgi:GT2 family glycosyltransferase